MSSVLPTSTREPSRRSGGYRGRTPRPHRPRRVASTAGVAVIAAVLGALLTACVPTASFDGTGASTSTTSAPTPTSSAGPTDGLDTPEDLTFAAGAVVGSRLRAQWADSLIADADYTLTTPDDGNGNWAYTQSATQCEVRFWQGDVSAIAAPDDDRSLSDAVLATWLQVSADQVTAVAQDDAVGYVPGTSGSTQVRLVSGSTSSGGTWIAAARGLGAIHGGFLVQVTCPSGQDPQTLYGSLRADKLVIVVGPGL